MNGTDEPRFRLGLARGALAWEQIWPAFWPAVGVAGLFIAIALFNVLPSLGGWLHALVLLLFAAAFAAALWYGIRRIRLPDGTAALRRLERDSGLTHRPLAALRDTMAGASDPATAELWRLYQEQARQRMRNLKVRLPHPNLAARDPWGLARRRRPSPVRRRVRHLGRLETPPRRRPHASSGRLRPRGGCRAWMSG